MLRLLSLAHVFSFRHRNSWTQLKVQLESGKKKRQGKIKVCVGSHHHSALTVLKEWTQAPADPPCLYGSNIDIVVAIAICMLVPLKGNYHPQTVFRIQSISIHRVCSASSPRPLLGKTWLCPWNGHCSIPAHLQKHTNTSKSSPPAYMSVAAGGSNHSVSFMITAMRPISLYLCPVECLPPNGVSFSHYFQETQ